MGPKAIAEAKSLSRVVASASQATIEGAVTRAPRLDRSLQAEQGDKSPTQDRPESALVRISHAVQTEIAGADLEVLAQRLSHTLQSIADRRGVTRERVRQMEARANRRLNRVLAAEPDFRDFLMSALADGTKSEASIISLFVQGDGHELRRQRIIGRICLRHLGAVQARTFDGTLLQDFWCLDKSDLVNKLRQVVDIVPCNDTIVREWLASQRLDPYLDGAKQLTLKGSPVRYHPHLRAWVHRVGADRDAAWILLQRLCRPAEASEIAEQLGRSVHALEEAMRRDDRFRQLRPSGRWTIADWKVQESKYIKTIDAVLEVLEEAGPMHLAQLARNVAARHPVSHSAVAQCLADASLGRWPDGRVDLASRGAPRLPTREPRKPSSVFVEEGGQVLAWRTVVNHDLVRGSGLGIPSYITWFLGLTSAPAELTFTTPDGLPLTIRRRIQGSTVSSLRSAAARLDAEDGCVLILRLRPRTRRASISLACARHRHEAFLPVPFEVSRT
jgi:hypothetical protein